jgi:Skp family chaperone for outer membrane proteins
MVKKYSLFVVVLTVASSTIIGDNLQIAFVDSFKAMRECKDGQVVGKELDTMREKFSKEIQQEAQKIAEQEKGLKAKASTLKPDVLVKEQRQLDKLKRDLEETVREKEETLKVTMQQKTEELATKIEEGIVAVAKEKGVDAVIDKMTGRVMYTKDDNTGDITKDAITFIDKKAITVATKKDEKPKAAIGV